MNKISSSINVGYNKSGQVIMSNMDNGISSKVDRIIGVDLDEVEL